MTCAAPPPALRHGPHPVRVCGHTRRIAATARRSHWHNRDPARPAAKLLDKGVCGSVAEIAEAEKISKSYVSRILRLALLTPDIVETVLGGWADQRLILGRLERPLPASWRHQRALRKG